MNNLNQPKREIQCYSNPLDERLDYKKTYWFHHWITPNKALIENSNGELLTIDYKGNFKFKQ